MLFISGCQLAPPDPLDDPLVARFFLENRPGEAGVSLQLPISKTTITVNPRPVMMETDIMDAALVRVNTGWCMMIRFTPEAAHTLYGLSTGNRGRRLVLVFNDKPAGALRIEQAMPEGALLVFIEVDDVNLPPLVERLKRTTAGITKRPR